MTFQECDKIDSFSVSMYDNTQLWKTKNASDNHMHRDIQ